MRSAFSHGTSTALLVSLLIGVGGCGDSGGAASDDVTDGDVADSGTADADTADTPDGSDTDVVDGAASDTGSNDAGDTANTDVDIGGDLDTPDAIDAPDIGNIGEDPEACRLAFNGGDAVGVGFPTPAPRLRSTGTVRAAVIFVDFTDVAPDRTPEDVFAMLTPGAEEFFDDVSYGRLELILDPHLEWLHLSGPAATYAAGLTTFFGHRDFIAEAVALADPDVDFSQADLVVVMSTPNASEVGYGPTWMGGPGWEIEADGNAMTNGITSGADLLYWGSLWLNHEMGHSMSLPDLYEFGANNGFTRPFGVMDLIDSTAPENLAWERWQLGWIDDEQVICNPDDTEIPLRAIETPGGLKAVMVRLSPTRVLVAESRRAIGWDHDLDPTGVVVSVVDTDIATGAGPIRVLNDQQALRLGEQVTLDGVTIEVVAATEGGDTIRVTAQ